MLTTLLPLIANLQEMQNTPESLQEKQHGEHKVNKKRRVVQKTPLGLHPASNIEFLLLLLVLRLFFLLFLVFLGFLVFLLVFLRFLSVSPLSSSFSSVSSSFPSLSFSFAWIS